MGRTKSITVDIKKNIIKLFEKENTQIYIANMCCLSQPSVINVIKEWEINNSLTYHKKRAGRSMVMNPRS